MAKQSKPQHTPKAPKKDWRKTAIAVFAGVMVVAMLLPMIATVITSVSAQTSQEELKAQIAASQSQATELEGQIAALQLQLDALNGEKADAVAQKSLLEQQIAVQQQSINQMTQTITQYDALILAKQGEVESTQTKEAVQFDLFCKRVRAMEEEGDITYWDILFSADNFADLLDRAVFITDVMEADNAIMDQLLETRLTLQEQKIDLETVRQAQQTEKEELEVAKAELEADEAEIDVVIANIQADADAVARVEANLKAEADRVTNDISKKQKELEDLIAAGQVSFDPSSGWQWPIPGHYQITSLFANRKHPITGVYGHHTGTDIAAPNGTPIKAAANGVVLISTYGSSYGNYVVIQHQNGIQTLYAHMNSRACSEGDVVSQGEVIGYIGSTGSSTGNHLHYEFRVNGVRKDALSYYPSINFDFSRV